MFAMWTMYSSYQSLSLYETRILFLIGFFIFRIGTKISSLFLKRLTQETADLVTFTEEIRSGKLYFVCSVGSLLANSS